ncbi:hypothetical protein TNCV_1355241 [Trichonephila clavipes]|uniref:Uncharacterized protein n=1 Tax=Trichonephila clavipes TaxID=2585209 RepID=A0A8X6SB46_TRICX|nr:hypothetical protein TNCV_1355241 [Trichonephila clavipes]
MTPSTPKKIAYGNEYMIIYDIDEEQLKLYTSGCLTPTRWDCGIPVVKVSDDGRHVTSSSPVPPKTHRVGQRCTLNLSRAETSSRWCGS